MSSSSRQVIEDIWDAYAKSYDSVLPILPFYQEAVNRHVAALSIHGARNVIDVGAGTGNVAIPLVQRGIAVTAIDISAGMLKQLRSKAKDCPPEKLDVVEQDAQYLDRWPAGTFDGANVLLAFFAMEQPRRALREVIRVVRSGGLVVITETRRNFQLQPLLDFVERFLAVHPCRGELQEDWVRVRNANVVLDPGRRHDRLSAEEIEQELAESGFVVKSSLDSHLGQCATICAEKIACQ
jgi:ubiquinone/menaquinone biosynthesis C-methylase UbiE